MYQILWNVRIQLMRPIYLILKESSLDCRIWYSFAHFSTVKCVTTISFLFFWRHSCCKKVPVEKESELSRGGAITFHALFHKNHIHFLNDIRRKLYMVRTHSTVEKWAKRMPYPTVETTEKINVILLYSILFYRHLLLLPVSTIYRRVWNSFLLQPLQKSLHRTLELHQWQLHEEKADQ